MKPRADKPSEDDRSDAELLRRLVQIAGPGPYGQLPKPVVEFLETATEDQLRAVAALVLARWGEAGE